MSAAQETLDRLETAREPGPYVQADILRSRLVDFRHQAELSQGDVVKQLGLTISTVHRTETGPTLPSPKTMAAMLAMYGVVESDVDTMIEEVNHITHLRNRIRRQYPGVPDSQLAYADHEAYASQIDRYEPRFMPEFLQPVGYNKTARSSLFPNLDYPDWLDDFNAQRKEYLLGPDGPVMRIIIAEEAVMTNAGFAYASRHQRPTAIGEFINGLHSINTVGQMQREEAVAPDKNLNVSVILAPFSHGLYPLVRYWKSVVWMHFSDPQVKPRGYYTPPQEEEFRPVEPSSADFGELLEDLITTLPKPRDTDNLISESVSQYLQQQ